VAIDPAMEAVQQAAVCRETAISCLELLSAQIGVYINAEEVRSRQQLRGATLPVSELIEVANDFGLKAEFVHRDWAWLQRTVATQPILLLLNNGNTVVAVRAGRSGAEEIVVSDPLYRGGAQIFLPRASLEPVWHGDAMPVTPLFVVSEGESSGDHQRMAEHFSNKTGFAKLFGVILLYLGTIALVTALGARPIKEKVTAFQTPSPALPAAVPLQASSVNTEAGNRLADQVLQEVTFIASILGSIAAPPISSLPAVSSPAGSGNASVQEAPAVAPGTMTPKVTDSDANSAGSPAAAPAPGEVLANVTPPVAGSQPAGVGAGVRSVPIPPATEVAALLARGDDQFRLGDVASARLFYEYAAHAGAPNAALRLGETYDPIFLDRTQIHGVRGDIRKALFWYRRARDLGSDEAGKLLKDLDANQGADR
jgi:hypothetical protein